MKGVIGSNSQVAVTKRLVAKLGESIDDCVIEVIDEDSLANDIQLANPLVESRRVVRDSGLPPSWFL